MFDPDVRLPAGLDAAAIRRAIEYIETALNDRDFIDLYFEQANVFSAIVGMFGTKALDSGGGRTHTFGVRRPAGKLRDCAAYRYSGVVLKGGKPVPVNDA